MGWGEVGQGAVGWGEVGRNVVILSYAWVGIPWLPLFY